MQKEKAPRAAGDLVEIRVSHSHYSASKILTVGVNDNPQAIEDAVDECFWAVHTAERAAIAGRGPLSQDIGYIPDKCPEFPPQCDFCHKPIDRYEGVFLFRDGTGGVCPKCVNKCEKPIDSLFRAATPIIEPGFPPLGYS